MKKIFIFTAIIFLLNNYAYGGSNKRTPWFELKKHWEQSTTKDDALCFEYMTRAWLYDYTVPHQNPIKKVAVLPPPDTSDFIMPSIVCFEQNVLFNMEEMKSEYLIPPKKWTVVKSFNDSYKILKEQGLYDKYQGWLKEFISYRNIDKGLFLQIAEKLESDTLLLLLIGHDRPGIAAARLKSEAYNRPQPPILNVYLFSAKEGKIIWEFCGELDSIDQYIITRWKGTYRDIYKIMPVE